MDRRAVTLAAASSLSSAVAWSRRDRRLDPRALLARAGQAPDSVKVNLGSSLLVAPGWVNVEGSVVALLGRCPRAVLRPLAPLSAVGGSMTGDTFADTLRGHVFVHHDLRYGAPFIDASVDVALMSHFLEHLSRSQGRALLAECRRVLRPGGLLRVAVPDLAPAIQALKADRLEEGLAGIFMDGVTHEADYHHYGYDERLLAETLAEAGFVAARRCDFREGDAPDLERLDNRPDGTLFMEARRPG